MNQKSLMTQDADRCKPSNPEPAKQCWLHLLRPTLALASTNSHFFPFREYKLLSEYESENEVCIIYQFCKNDIHTIMAQRFEMLDHKISKILLIFDLWF